MKVRPTRAFGAARGIVQHVPAATATATATATAIATATAAAAAAAAAATATMAMAKELQHNLLWVILLVPNYKYSKTTKKGK